MRCHLALCFALVPACCPPPTTSGALHAAGGALGTWDFVPDPARCQSGDAREFLGVDLGDGARGVRLVDDPATGYALVIGVDLAYPQIVYRPADCAAFSASVAENDDGTVSGGFSVACPATTDAGFVDGLQGSITFGECGTSYEDC